MASNSMLYGYSIYAGEIMTVRLNITMDDALYARLRRTVRLRKLSVFITEAIRARLTPDRATLDAAYRAARKERWRRRLTDDWRHTKTKTWPE